MRIGIFLVTSTEHKNELQRRSLVEMGHDFAKAYKDHCLLGIMGVMVLILDLTPGLFED